MVGLLDHWRNNVLPASWSWIASLSLPHALELHTTLRPLLQSRIEYIDFSGLRLDGRRPREVRRVRCQMGVFPRADGSALFEQGNTKALAVVTGPREPTRSWEAANDTCILSCEYSVSPFAASNRIKRRAGDRRNMEASTAIQQSLETAVMMHLYPNSEIEVKVQVLQTDGGALTAAINACTLALIDAGIAMRDFVVGCSVTYIQRTPLLDPNYTESVSGGAELILAILPRSEAVTLTTMDARLPLDAFEPMLELGTAGCRQIFDIMQSTVKEQTANRLASRGTITS